MTCNEAATLLDPFRHGDLSGSQAASVQQHLDACPSCMERFKDQDALARLLRLRSDEVETALPPGFSRRVLEALPRGREVNAFGGRGPFRIFVLGALATAAIAAAVILPIRYGRHSALEAASLAAENEAQIHRLEVGSEETHPLVFKTAAGLTVIWMISDTEFNQAGAPAPTDSRGTLPQK
jgi:predicted anti-sigma-YlaC factor YlaD